MKKSFVRKLVAVISAMVMSVAAMATTANAAAPSGGGTSASTNGYVTENGIEYYIGAYSLKKERSGTHYNTYSTSNTTIPYKYTFHKFTINCTSYTCTVAGTFPKCKMGCETVVTAGPTMQTKIIGYGFPEKFLYDKVNYIAPITLSTVNGLGQFFQVNCTLYDYSNATYCYMTGDYKLY